MATWHTAPTSTEIRQLRHLLGFSQEAFARFLGVSWQSVSRWERGKRRPTGLYAKLLRG